MKEGVSMSDGKLEITCKNPKGDDGYRTFSIRIKAELVENIESIVVKTGRTRNELISILLEYALNNFVIQETPE